MHKPSDGNTALYYRNMAEIAEAIQHDQFVPFYQPKVNLRTGVVDCVEMLARWDHPYLGILPPDRFIPLIERSGLMEQFTANLLYKAFPVGRAQLQKTKNLGLLSIFPRIC